MKRIQGIHGESSSNLYEEYAHFVTYYNFRSTLTHAVLRYPPTQDLTLDYEAVDDYKIKKILFNVYIMEDQDA